MRLNAFTSARNLLGTQGVLNIRVENHCQRVVALYSSLHRLNLALLRFDMDTSSGFVEDKLLDFKFLFSL